MPAQRKILPLVISGLLIAPAARTEPQWVCQADANGAWRCASAAEDLTAPDALMPDTEAREVQAGETPAGAAAAPEERETPAADLQPGETESESVPTLRDPMALPEEAPKPQQNGAEDGATDAPPLENDTSTEDQSRGTTSSQPLDELPSETAARPDSAIRDKAPVPTTYVVAEAPVTARATDGQAASNPEAQSSPIGLPDADRQSAISAPEDEDAVTVTATESTRQQTALNASPPHDVAADDSELLAKGTGSIDRGLDWQRCRPPEQPVPLSFEAVEDESTLIEADDASLMRQKQQALFQGNVAIRRGEQLLEADEVRYDLEYETLDASGNVYYERPGLRVTGSQAHFDLNTSQGNMQAAEYRLPDRNGRGNASTADIDGEDLSHYTDLTYTTCPPGNSDWLLQAKKFDADQDSGRGVARHATLSFRDQPVAYLPYISFPIDDRRHSGFLAPTFGNSESTGLDVTVPYYFNIAPEMDATLSPRVMSKRGLLLGGEFRYLAENHHSEIKAEILPHDKDAREEESSTRGALSWQAGGDPAPRWSYDIDVNHASDDNYLNDLSDSFALVSARHLERRGDLRYSGDGWNLLGRLQHYQTIDQNIATENKPYSRLPQLLLGLSKPDQALGLTYYLGSEYVHFDKNDNNIVTGHRVDLRPGVSLPMRRSWGYLAPNASLRYTKYQLNDQVPGESDNPDRTLPTISLDGGLFFERDDSWFGKSVTQTLEPRLFYLFTPNTNQDDLPDFDTAEVDFSFANLFRDNRFSGADRVGDANQLTTALTSRMYGNQSGEELFRASFGQIAYFRDRKVQLSGDPVEKDTDDSSSLVAEAAAQFTPALRTRAGIQWNPYESGGKTEKGAASIHYGDSEKRVLNLGYRYTRELFEQTDVSFRWPLTSRLHGVGRWNYSLKYDQTMAAFVGFEYESCCWITRLVAQQLRISTNDNDDSELQNSVFLQLELKGLTSIGDKVDQYLDRAIPGYQDE